MTWCQDASIDSGSGAITLQLVRMFDKPYKVTTVQTSGEDDGYFFAVEEQSTAAWFSSRTPPQKPEQPCYIFLAFHVQSPVPEEEILPFPVSPGATYFYTPDTYVVFATKADVSGAFTIVQCFPIDDVVCLSVSPTLPSTVFSSLELVWDHIVMSLFETLHWTLNYNTREERTNGRSYHFDHPDRTYMSHPWDNDCGTVSEAMLFDMIVPGGGEAASGFLQLSLAAGLAGDPVTVTEGFKRAYANCLQTASAEFKPVLDNEYVWFTMADDDALSHYWNSVIKHISDAEASKKKGLDQWVPWDILFPRWFDLQIPGVGNTIFNEQSCKLSKVWQPGMEDQESDGVESPCFDRCTLHEDYKSQSNLSLKYWLPCTSEPRELQMPVRARMPLIDVVGAIRSTGLNWLHRNLLAFSERVSEDVATVLERGPQPEDRNVYLQKWPEALVEELGFVWRKESVTFV